MRLFSYIVTHDIGFAPNPFWGYCTLACCKPVIRRTANPGDWIIGLTKKSEGHKMLYAMSVIDKLDFAEYFRDTRFQRKKPDYDTEKVIHKCGDNIYEPLADGDFRQLRSAHSKNDGTEDPKSKKTDLGGRYVLVSKEFIYFGSDAVELPSELGFLIAGRGHRSNFFEGQIQAFLDFLCTFEKDIHGSPRLWPSGDVSWRKIRSCGGHC